MSYYEVLLFLHIGTAALWMGGASLFFVVVQRAKRAPDPVLAERLGAHGEWLAKRFFVPSSIAVLVLGILLTIEGPWSFDQLWIVLALVGMGGLLALGIGVIEPTLKKLHAAAEAHGPAHPDVARYSRRLDALGLLDLSLLLSMVWIMVFKPTSDDLGTLVLPALLLAAVAFIIVRVYRAGASETAPAAG
jgi:uncharacterized membrane protein